MCFVPPTSMIMQIVRAHSTLRESVSLAHVAGEKALCGEAVGPITQAFLFYIVCLPILNAVMFFIASFTL